MYIILILNLCNILKFKFFIFYAYSTKFLTLIQQKSPKQQVAIEI